MLRFEYSNLLWLLVVVPLFTIYFIFWQRRRRKILAKSIDKGLHNIILPNLSFGKQRLKFILTMIALCFIIISAANPQVPTSIGDGQRKGCDIIICLDVSNSMLAEDLTPNRLERAKLAINQLIPQLKGDRIGIVPFAGSSFTFLPLTGDYATAKMFTDIIDTRIIDNQGTDIYSALLTAAKSFPKDKDKKRTRAIILISDGEDLQSGAEELAKDIAKEDVIISCIGIGSKDGAKIPINGNGVKTFKKDRQGNIIVTHLDEGVLKNIAAKSGGIYVKASSANMGLEDILSSLNKMDKKDYKGIGYRDYATVFYFPAVIALILLIIDACIFNAKNKYINRKFFFGKE